jgi:hypothetical protein
MDTDRENKNRAFESPAERGLAMLLQGEQQEDGNWKKEQVCFSVHVLLAGLKRPDIEMKKSLCSSL